MPHKTTSQLDTGRVFYGWVIVFAAAVLTSLCFGIIALVAVLIKPFEAEFGWQRGEISMTYTLATIATALAGVVFGRLCDRHGARALAILGAVTIAFSLILLSRIEALWQLYAVYVFFGAVGFGALSIPMTVTVTNWFTKNRGLAVGLATAGGAIGQGVVPFVARYLMTGLGWRESFVVMGLAYLIIALPLALLVRKPPDRAAALSASQPSTPSQEDLPLEPKQALAWLCTAVIFCCICMSVPIVHVAALANDAGIGLQQSAGVLLILMLAGATGRVAIGRIADSIGTLNAYMLASLWQTATVYWFVLLTEPASFYLLAAVFGFGFGGVMTSFLLTVRSLVPTSIAGMSMALVVLFGWVGMGLGGYFGGVLFDISGNYHLSFGASAVSGIINLSILTVLALRLRRGATIGAPA